MFGDDDQLESFLPVIINHSSRIKYYTSPNIGDTDSMASLLTSSDSWNERFDSRLHLVQVA